MAWLIPLVLGTIAQNVSNKQTAAANAGSNAGSVANASTAWNNAFRRMAPWLKPGAGPFGGMSVSPVGAPSYGTPYGANPSPSGVMGTAGGGGTAAGGGGAGGMQSIIAAIMQRLGMGGGGASPSGVMGPAPNSGGTTSPVMTGQPVMRPQTGFGTAPGGFDVRSLVQRAMSPMGRAA